MNNNNNFVYANFGNGMVEYSKKFLNTHYYNTATSKWHRKPSNNHQSPKPQRRFKNRVAHAFRRRVGTTVNGKNVYKGIRGGMFTANGTPVHNRNGKLTTN
jgi:hypothetical protein